MNYTTGFDEDDQERREAGEREMNYLKKRLNHQEDIIDRQKEKLVSQKRLIELLCQKMNVNFEELEDKLEGDETVNTLKSKRLQKQKNRQAQSFFEQQLKGIADNQI